MEELQGCLQFVDIDEEIEIITENFSEKFEGEKIVIEESLLKVSVDEFHLEIVST